MTKPIDINSVPLTVTIRLTKGEIQDLQNAGYMQEKNLALLPLLAYLQRHTVAAVEHRARSIRWLLYLNLLLTAALAWKVFK